MATILSAGWVSQLDRYFNDLRVLTISQLYNCVPINITHLEYIGILKNSWSRKKYFEADFRSWVADGFLTADEFFEITGIVY